MKKVILSLSAVFVLGFVAACGDSEIEQVEGEANAAEEANVVEENAENGNNEVAVEDENEANEEEAVEEEEVVEDGYGIGDTVQFDDLNITLLGARVITDDLFEADNGKFVGVELEIENTSDESENISTMLSMDLMTSDGYSMDHAMVSGRGSLDGELGPGRSLKGEVVFDTEEAEFYEFFFENPFTSGQAIWEIQDGEIE